MNSSSQTEQNQGLRTPNEEWFRLDNAATVFSFVTSARIPCMFRLIASLKQPINIANLQQALENIINRFPYYKVNLRNGLFWSYWETNPGMPVVIEDTKYPCQQMPIRKKGIFPFRVRAFYNRISVEFHHSITDGSGSMIFLKSLVGEYLNLSGIRIDDWQEIFRPSQEPHIEEYEDAFKKNYQESIPWPARMTRAFHLPFKLEPKGVYHITTGIMQVKQLLSRSKELDVTLTEYLTAVYLEALQAILFSLPQRKQKRLMKPIRLQVPVNLRRFFPSKTMRNFSLYVTPGIDPRLGRFTFEEILKQVYHYMRVEVSDRYISQFITRNVRGELHPIIRVTPLFIKRLFGKVIYNGQGEFLYSGVITNIGKVTLPAPINNEVEEIQVLPAPSPVTKTGCAVNSYKDKLYINFGRTIKEAHLEKLFFRKLVKDGLNVKIETN